MSRARDFCVHRTWPVRRVRTVATRSAAAPTTTAWVRMSREERAVYLLRAGCSPDEIVYATGLGQGDVDLIAERRGFKFNRQKFDC